MRFVGVTRVPLCARVSCVRPVCVPAPPGVFLPVPVPVVTAKFPVPEIGYR